MPPPTYDYRFTCSTSGSDPDDSLGEDVRWATSGSFGLGSVMQSKHSPARSGRQCTRPPITWAEPYALDLVHVWKIVTTGGALV
jgi:hypothetical protein